MLHLAPNPPRPAKEPLTVVDFPDQMRNDIFYCQRALKEHIKIHQVSPGSPLPARCSNLTFLSLPVLRSPACHQTRKSLDSSP